MSDQERHFFFFKQSSLQFVACQNRTIMKENSNWGSKNGVYFPKIEDILQIISWYTV